MCAVVTLYVRTYVCTYVCTLHTSVDFRQGDPGDVGELGERGLPGQEVRMSVNSFCVSGGSVG